MSQFAREQREKFLNRKKNNSQTGAVLVFKPDISVEEAKRVIEVIAPYLDSGTIKEFDPDIGYPVFYVP